MKLRRKRWIGSLLCIALLLQTLSVSAAETIPEEETEMAQKTVEYCLSVKDTDYGTVEVKGKEKQADGTYKYLAEEEIAVQISSEEGYEIENVTMDGLDTNTKLAETKKGNLYTWKAKENMELSVSFCEVKKEEAAPEIIPEEEPETIPEEELEASPEEETEPETEETDSEQEQPEEKLETPESELLETEAKEDELLSLQPDGLLKNRMSLFAARANTITYLGKVSYGGTAVGHFLVNGQVAFCMEHQKTTPPDGTSFSEQIYNNATIRKVLYYGWGGPEQWSGFGSEAQGIVCTSLTLSYYYSGPDSIILLGGPMDANIGVSAFMNYINSMPNVADPDIAISKSYTESYLSDDKTYQRTESIKLNADTQNTITIPLPSGVTLVNETTGTTGTGNVKVKGGDTFYLKAPLTMNGTWSSGKMYGSMGKFQSVLLMTSSSSLQNLGQGNYGATDPNAYVELSVKWVQLGDIRITKFLGSDGEIKTPAVGAEFTLTHQETGEQVVIVADEDGVATSEDRANYPVGRLIGGEWLVEETKTPEGYKPIDSFTVTVYGQGQIFSYIVEDKEIYAPLQVVKVDESTGNIIAASGATFKIVDENGQDVEFTSYSPSKETFVEFATDKNGQFTLPEKLKHGKYKLVEVKAPEGYLLCEPIDFEVTEYQDWDTPFVITAEDENAMGVIKLKKTEKDDPDRTIAGAEYSIYAAEDITTGDGTVRAKAGELVGTLTTNLLGQAESGELFLGKYIVKETKAPSGYVLDKTEYEVELAYKDQETEIVYQDLEVADQATKVVITKKVAGKDTVLEGVKFNVWNKGMDSDVDMDISFKEMYITDENGQISLEYLSSGTYCVQEKETIGGYLLDDTVYEFTVDENGYFISFEDSEPVEEGNLIIENDYTKLHVSKQDATTGKELPGAELEIRDTEDNVIDKWTSTEEVHVIEAIPAGEYILRETIAPEGYLIAQEIRFTIKDTGEVQHVVMKDELKVGTIRTNIPNNFREGSHSSGGIKTGDQAQITLLLAMIGVSLVGIGYILYWNHKRRKKVAKNE